VVAVHVGGLLLGAAVADTFVLPGPGFFVSLAVAVLATFALPALTLPFMDAVTRHDSVRYE
jgi:hypothetical protein